MLGTDIAIWDELLEHVRTSISETDFNTWFTQLQPVGLEDGAFVIGVPTTFARDWIGKNFTDELESGLSKLGIKSPRIGLKVLPQDTFQQQDLFAEPPPEPARPVSNSRLSSKYHMANFVVGPNNNLAHAAALAVAERPGTAYNPLFLYGEAGLGKTHLMHAVGHLVRERFPHLSVEYVTTEAFTNDLINAIRAKDTNSFRERYRGIDLLLVDDVQFIAGKEQTQEEFFHTFNALYESGKQIILSSDRPPKNIPTLESRLRSRFEWGLITDIQPPEFETRVAILKQNAEQRNVKVPDDVVEYIARHATSNIRELEGALMRVIVQASMGDQPLNAALAAAALSDVFSSADAKLGLEDILRVVARSFGVEIRDVKSKGRRQELVVPRQIAMYLMRELTPHSFPEIGQFFTGRDHSTVMYAVTKVTDQLKTDAELQRRIREIRQSLG